MSAVAEDAVMHICGMRKVQAVLDDAGAEGAPEQEPAHAGGPGAAGSTVETSPARHEAAEDIGEFGGG